MVRTYLRSKNVICVSRELYVYPLSLYNEPHSTLGFCGLKENKKNMALVKMDLDNKRFRKAVEVRVRLALV